MKCPYCNKYVLKVDVECPNCHNSLILAQDRYGGEGQYRSRFKLLIKYILGNGAYLRWLGYEQEANEHAKNEVKQAFGLVGNVFGSMANPANLVGVFIDFFAKTIRSIIDIVLIILGLKYKYDAYGHPVCYFDPNKKVSRNKESKINFADIDVIEANNLKDFSDSDIMQNIVSHNSDMNDDKKRDADSIKSAFGLAGNAADISNGLSGTAVKSTNSEVESGVGIAGSAVACSIGLAGATVKTTSEKTDEEMKDVAGIAESAVVTGIGLVGAAVENTAEQTNREVKAGVGIAGSTAATGIGLVGVTDENNDKQTDDYIRISSNTLAGIKTNSAETVARAKENLKLEVDNVNVGDNLQNDNTDCAAGTSSDDNTVSALPKLDDVTHIADNVLICPKCKFANNVTLNFCGNCGQPLRNNGKDGAGNSSDNGVVTAIVKYKNYIFSVLAILIIIVCGIGAFKNYVNTPEKVVEKYLTAISKQDYATAYGQLFLTEDDFINKENYIKSIEFIKKNPSAFKDTPILKLSREVTDVKVMLDVGRINSDGLTHYQYIARMSDNRVIKGEIDVVDPISSWDKILNKYKILNNDLVSVQDIEVENNAKFYIDGVLMKNPTVTERGTHNYNARIFYGEHNIKVEAPFCDPYETKLILTPSTKSPVLYYWKSHLKKDVLQDMEKQSEDIQRKIIEGAVKNESLENLQLGFSEAKLSSMYDQYKRFFNRADGSGIYSMDITEVTSNEQYNNRLYNPFKNRIYKINFKFNYTRKNRNGIQESRVGNGEGELGVVFKLENDKVVPVAIDTFRLRTH